MDMITVLQICGSIYATKLVIIFYMQTENYINSLNECYCSRTIRPSRMQVLTIQYTIFKYPECSKERISTGMKNAEGKILVMMNEQGSSVYLSLLHVLYKNI